ncbi:MAG: hypothetical protein J7497_16155, partial [Chitinophagaceae bacterium]|nr:hypothetical protein [Chitinophagaceae bacterium]
VLVTRTAFHNRTNETINGAGTFNLEETCSYSVVGKEFTSIINVGNACEQHFFDTAWQRDYIYEKDIPALAEAFENSFPGLPRRVFAAPMPLTAKITSLIANLETLDHSLPQNKPTFRALMRDCLKIVIDECFHHEYAKRVLKHNYQLVVAIRDFIINNLKRQYTDEELAKEFFTTEGRIKYLKKLTSLAPEQFRRYMLNHNQCVTKKKENLTNAQLYEGADYADEPSFINGCIAHLGTTPDNLKNNKWTPDKPFMSGKPVKRRKRIANALTYLMTW